MSLVCAALLLMAPDQRQVMTITPVDAAIPGMAVVRPVPTADTPGQTIQDEPPQMPGWPLTTSKHINFAPMRGAVAADLDSDGLKELLVPSTDGRLNAWRLDGTVYPGFPKTTIGFPQYPPSVGDLDGDGQVEIVQTTRGFTSGGRLYVMDRNGNNLPGWPKSLNGNNVEYSATLADLDGDTKLEIIVGERAYPVGRLHVFEKDGTEWGGNWPVTIDHVPTQTAAVADVDGDGDNEIFYPSYTSMYLLQRDGTNMPGWPKQVPNASFSYQSAALADLDGDNDLEIVTATHGAASGFHAFRYDGTVMPGWPRPTQTWTYCAPTVTDLEGDGNLEVIGGQAGGGSTNPGYWVWNRNGQVRAGFPYLTAHGGSEGPMTVADTDGDGVQEIFSDHNYMDGGLGYLFGVDANGQDLPGFPLRTGGFTFLNGATIADMDNDGDYELAVLAFTDYVVTVYLYTLSGQRYSSAGLEWPGYHARNLRDGLFSPVARFAPSEFRVTRGVLQGGDLASLANVDNNELIVRNGLVVNQTEHPITVEFDAISTRPSPVSLELDVTFRVSAGGLSYVLDLFDWNANTWDTVDTKSGSAPMNKTTFTVVGTSVGRYVQAGTGKVRARIRAKFLGFATTTVYTSSVDAVTWRVR